MIDHVFIDLEMGGKDTPVKSVAAIRTTAQGNVLCAVANAGSLRDIVAAISTCTAPFSAPYIAVAERANEKRNALTDARFVNDMHRTHREEPLSDPFKGRAWLDFGQVAWPLALADLVPNRSLEAIGRHFGVKRTYPGTLTGDCSYMAEVYWTMARSYRTALKAEHAAKEVIENAIGGETVSFLRRLAGV